MEGCVLVRYGEIALKSNQTRKWWNKILLDNMRDCLEKNDISYSSINVVLGRFIVYTEDHKKSCNCFEEMFLVSHLYLLPSKLNQILK